MLNTIETLQAEKSKSFGVLPQNKEIMLDVLLAMDNEASYQASHGGKDIGKFKLSDFAPIETPTIETRQVDFSPLPIAMTIESPRIQESPKLPDSTIMRSPSGKLLPIGIARHNLALQAIGKKSETATLGKPVSSIHYPNRFKRIYESTLNPVIFALDVLGGERSLVDLQNCGKIVNRKLNNLATVLVAHKVSDLPKKSSLKNKNRASDGIVLRQAFLMAMTGKKTRKAQIRALQGNESPDIKPTKTRERKSVKIAITESDKPMVFHLSKRTLTELSNVKHVMSLGIQGMTPKLFNDTKKLVLSNGESQVLQLGKFSLTFTVMYH